MTPAWTQHACTINNITLRQGFPWTKISLQVPVLKSWNLIM